MLTELDSANHGAAMVITGSEIKGNKCVWLCNAAISKNVFLNMINNLFVLYLKLTRTV